MLARRQSLASPELAVRGVSSVFGNTGLDEASAILAEAVRRFGPPDLPVAVGAAVAGATSAATTAMARALEDGPLTIAALGPLTNVASLLLLHPELRERVAEVVCVAGRRPGQLFRVGERQPRPFRDFNFELDPAAMAVVLDAGVPLTFAPWEASRDLWVGDADLRALAAGGAAARWLAGPARDWLDLWVREFGAPGFTPFDAVAVAWLALPGLVRSEPGFAAIEHGPDDRGGDGKKPYLHVRPEGGCAVRYCTGVAPELKEDMLLRNSLAGS